MLPGYHLPMQAFHGIFVSTAQAFPSVPSATSRDAGSFLEAGSTCVVRRCVWRARAGGISVLLRDHGNESWPKPGRWSPTGSAVYDPGKQPFQPLLEP